MLTTIELPPETVREVVFTCVVLHNILRSQYQGQHGGQEPRNDDDDDRGITSRTTSIMREQWPGKMAENNCYCSNQ